MFEQGEVQPDKQSDHRCNVENYDHAHRREGSTFAERRLPPMTAIGSALCLIEDEEDMKA
jgi:hypothetical protein